ncbi:MAG: class I tRNA ligase family protein [Oligoflexia bacterium]|nr:class I tRNA ligase family protein [Oligoflexia bacterium]
MSILDRLDTMAHKFANVITVLLTSLKLLHPFAPFVTEAIYQELKVKYNFTEQFLATSSWPVTINEK